jgi:glycosyltransferase involved in cell wall biosynthesis
VTLPKLTVATSFPVHPPRGGGQQRIMGLYGALARLGVEVEIVALVDRFGRAGRRLIAPGVYEVRVPKSAAHDAREFAMQKRAGVPVTDIALALHHELTPAYGDALATSAATSAAVVASHPYAAPALTAAGDRPFVYEAHNVEIDLKRAMFGQGGSDLLEAVEAVERHCCETADMVLACSPQDAERLHERYGVLDERVTVVPNGVDAGRRRYHDNDARRALKVRLGVERRFLALFVGSWHEPNLVALDEVLAAAHDLDDVTFAVVGSVGLAVDRKQASSNVDLCGVVADGFLDGVLAVADVALNPMRTGSGTNLKMLDYAAAGVPLVSTSIGARGLGFEAGAHYAPMDRDGLVATVSRVRTEAADAVQERARAARQVVENRFDWSVVAAGWAGHPWMHARLGVPV